MCLGRVTTLQPKKQSGIGYKAFMQVSDGRIKSRFFNFEFEEGVWNTDVRGRVIHIGGLASNKYPSGFHIFRLRRDAVAWGRAHFTQLVYAEQQSTIRRVRYDKAVAQGTSLVFYEDGTITNAKIIVARKIFIESK